MSAGARSTATITPTARTTQISWLSWELPRATSSCSSSRRQLIALRKQHPVLMRRRFFQGRSIHGGGIRDIAWFQPDGSDMTDEQWQNGKVRTLGMRLNGLAIEETDERGQRIVDDILLLLINGDDEVERFKLPGPPDTPRWEVILDTTYAELEPGRSTRPGEVFELQPRTLVLLRQPKEELE